MLNATKAWSGVGVIGILLIVGLLLLGRKVCYKNSNGENRRSCCRPW